MDKIFTAWLLCHTKAFMMRLVSFPFFFFSSLNFFRGVAKTEGRCEGGGNELYQDAWWERC